MNACGHNSKVPRGRKKGGKEKFLCVEDHPTFFLLSRHLIFHIRSRPKKTEIAGDFHIKFEQKSTGAFVFYFYYYSQKCSKREIEEEEALNTKRNAHRVCFIRMLYRYPRE